MLMLSMLICYYTYQALATLSGILATVPTGYCRFHSTTDHTIMKLSANNKKYASSRDTAAVYTKSKLRTQRK